MLTYPVQELKQIVANDRRLPIFYQGIPQIKVIPCMICCEESRLSGSISMLLERF